MINHFVQVSTQDADRDSVVNTLCRIAGRVNEPLVQMNQVVEHAVDRLYEGTMIYDAEGLAEAAALVNVIASALGMLDIVKVEVTDERWHGG